MYPFGWANLVAMSTHFGRNVCRDKFISPLSRFFVVFNYSTFVVWAGNFSFCFSDFVGLSHLNEMNE